MDDPQYSASGGPVVVAANWYRFRASELIHHDLVASLSFVWVVRGSGTIIAGGHEHRMTGNSVIRLPWRHTVEYRADARSPFSVGTIHVIPWHDSAVPVEPRVAYTAGDPLLAAPYRKGPASREAPLQLTSGSTVARNLIALGSFSVERFISSPFSESAFRALGQLVVEQNDFASSSADETPTPPTALELMTDYVSAHLDRSLTVDEIANVGSCSIVTAERLFARYTGRSVQSWVRGRRMEQAALLLRTSGLRVNEVARMVGFTDPLYFSRVFRSTFSIPPSRYAVGELRP